MQKKKTNVTELTHISVAQLTEHFTVRFCLLKINSAQKIPGIKKWIEKHKELVVYDWAQSFKLLSNKNISLLARDALINFLHRMCTSCCTWCNEI